MMRVEKFKGEAYININDLRAVLKPFIKTVGSVALGLTIRRLLRLLNEAEEFLGKE